MNERFPRLEARQFADAWASEHIIGREIRSLDDKEICDELDIDEEVRGLYNSHFKVMLSNKRNRQQDTK